MFVKPIHTTIFKNGGSLDDFIFRFIPKVKEKTVIVITSKIVALSQKRIVPGIISEKQKEDWIRKESDNYIKTKWCYLALANGHWCANAGIDESNAENGGLILWPKNPYHVAEVLRKKLQTYYRVKNLGILITDSRIFPLRSGVSGVAIGYAGFKGLRNYIGQKDIFGRR
ncbi:MAG: coenzyme F420-0:L-glutamate ligase, partial [Candidatus Azambacteria bacterium]|nr:coenzyme F420-0:L-glutamate ligase [Candidatus Azambacteria bacterium]